MLFFEMKPKGCCVKCAQMPLKYITWSSILSIIDFLLLLKIDLIKLNQSFDLLIYYYQCKIFANLVMNMTFISAVHMQMSYHQVQSTSHG